MRLDRHVALTQLHLSNLMLPGRNAEDFCKNTCCVCEIKKGGSACTTIGPEELDTCYNLYDASNKETDRIAGFLQSFLNVPRLIAHQAGTNDACRGSKFFQLCLRSAAEHIEQESKFLCRNVNDCLSKLNRQDAAFVHPFRLSI
ncbi:unnamed protein product [Penicillium salamii]|nr:unnamed protein product [Penicillium salamii]